PAQQFPNWPATIERLPTHPRMDRYAPSVRDGVVALAAEGGSFFWALITHRWVLVLVGAVLLAALGMASTQH
ncbi:unnamed protein product, partial [Amoebophrya sp. A120]